MDEAAFLLVAEQLDGGARDVEGAAQMHLDDLVPVLFAHLVEHLVPQDARRIDDGMQAAEAVLRLFDHVPDRRHAGDALGIGHSLAAGRLDLVGGLLGRTGRALVAAGDRTAQVIDQHLGAFAGRQQRTFLADTAGPAGDDDNLAFKHAHDLVSSRTVG